MASICSKRCRQHRARHNGEGCLAHSSVLHRVVHQHTAGTADLEGGGIKIAEGAQPGLLADLGRVGEQGGDHDVEQVEHVVLGACLQRPHKSEQRCHAPLQRHSRHGLRLGDGGETSQCCDPARGHMGYGGQSQCQRAHLVKSGDGTGQLGAAAQVWTVAQTVQRAGTAALAGNQQGVKLRALLGCHVPGKGAPEPAGGPGADACDQALKGRRARQKDFLRHQPGCCAIEQHARPIRARPAQGIEPACQAEADKRIGELAVAKTGADLPGVLPADPALAVQGKTGRVGDPELARHIAATPAGTSTGSSRNVPKNRTVPSCTAKPSRM